MSQELDNGLSLVTESRAPNTRERLMQEVINAANAQTVPSGILHRTSPRHSLLRDADGSADAPVLSQQDWQDALAELDAGRLAAAPPLFDTVQASAAAYQQRGQVPVFIAGFGYETLRGRVWAAIERMQQSAGTGSLPFAPADQVESRQAFLASAVLPREFAAFVAQPHVYYGQEVTFVFPTDGLLGDAAGGTALRVDFGDGAGPRPVDFDLPLTLHYASLGSKTLSLHLLTAAGERTASFSFTLVESLLLTQCPAFVRQERAPVTATIRRPGIPVVRAQAFVFRPRDRPRIVRPLLLVEGFPGNYPWEVAFRYANQDSFACKLMNQGYDVILVRFPDGPNRLEANAYALIALMLDLIAEREGSQPLIIGGFSMGGLIARYALAYMEHERRNDPSKPHHQTRKLFTIDSPHEGANLSVSVQAVAQCVRGGGEEAKLMRTPAAQQLLLTWIDPYPWKEGQRFGASPLRLEFLRELVRVGSMPRELEDTIAIANGEGTGRPQAAPGALATKYECTIFAFADYFLQPLDSPGALVAHISHELKIHKLTSPSGGQGVDSAPGGVWEHPLFRRAYDSVPWGVPKRLLVENSCFIPTSSALAISDSGYFRVPDLSRSKFKSVTYSHEGNLPHVKLTPTLTEFLLRFIAKSAADDAATAASVPAALAG